MDDPALERAVSAFTTERSYGAAIVERWRQLPTADAAALLSLAQELRLGENQLRDLWDWADEIAARDRLSLSDLLASPTITAARGRPVSRNDKLKLIKGALRCLRFPQLAALEDRLAILVRALDLPANVRVVLPEFLEGDAVRIEFAATNAAALRAAGTALARAADSSACTRSFGCWRRLRDALDTQRSLDRDLRAGFSACPPLARPAPDNAGVDRG